MKTPSRYSSGRLPSYCLLDVAGSLGPSTPWAATKTMIMMLLLVLGGSLVPRQTVSLVYPPTAGRLFRGSLPPDSTRVFLFPRRQPPPLLPSRAGRLAPRERPPRGHRGGTQSFVQEPSGDGGSGSDSASEVVDEAPPENPAVGLGPHLKAGAAVPRTGDVSAPTVVLDDDDSTQKFLRNIKSKLTLLPYYSDSFRRKRKASVSSRSSQGESRRRRWIGAALRKASSGILVPLRWLPRRVLRRAVGSKDVGSASADSDVGVKDASRSEVAADRTVTPSGTRSPSARRDSNGRSASSDAQVAGATIEPVAPVRELKALNPGAAAATAPRAAGKIGASGGRKIEGDRWAVSTVDLSGEWEIVVSDEFKQQYDRYLALLGQPVLIRSVALSIVGLTTEETIQRDDGRELFIRGRNVRGCWERSLASSGADEWSPEYEARRAPIVTADSETVYSEAWWEEGGTVHRSWLRGVQKYGGGDFESRRYLDGDELVCESTFHPAVSTREKASITWRFKRQTRNPT